MKKNLKMRKTRVEGKRRNQDLEDSFLMKLVTFLSISENLLHLGGVFGVR